MMSEAWQRARARVDAFERERAARPDRKAEGAYYTPEWVVEAMLDRLPLARLAAAGVLVDPAAGAGAFVLAVVRRLGPSVLERLYAVDIDPRALDACAEALQLLLGDAERERIARWRTGRAVVADFLRDERRVPPAALVVGNPPYGLVDDAALSQRFEMVRGELDLYACFLVAGARALAPGGVSALLVPDSWLTNQRAAGLRTWAAQASPLRVVDFGKPFGSARDTRVHMVAISPGAERCEVESLQEGALRPMASVTAEALAQAAQRGWFLYRTEDEVAACAALERGGRPLGQVHEVLYGLRTGANAVHLSAEAGPGSLPMVGGRDFDPFDRRLASRHLRDPAAFAGALAPQRGVVKLGIQRIRTNSRHSWRRWLEAAVVGPDEAGLDSLTLVRGEARELDDALCALLGVINASILNRWYRLHYTDVNIKPTYLRELPVPPTSAPLARLVRRRMASPGALSLERAIDRLVAHAYGLDDAALEVLEQGFWGAERAERPLPSLEEALALA